MAYELGYFDAEVGADYDDEELGARRRRFRGFGAIARRAAIAARARNAASIANTARVVGRPSVERTATFFQIAVELGAADTSGTATAQPLQGLNPKKVSGTSYDTTATSSAAAVDLLTQFQVGLTSQLTSAEPLPFEVIAPGAQNVLPFAISAIPAYTVVTAGVRRTQAPGAGASRRLVITVMGDTITA